MSVLATNSDLEIRKTTPADRSPVARVLAAAFIDDPVVRWCVPDDTRRAEVLEPMFELYFDAYQPHGDVYVNGSATGAALWLGPGRELFDGEAGEAFGTAMQELGEADAPRFFELGALLDAHHPTTPVYYLQFIGTLPERHGRGIGSALLTTVLAKADEAGVPSYLDATTPRNAALYERHGFQVLDEVAPAGGPSLWRMLRDPR
jgi:ribosomal protein S18 acetylase RimI-like enzyme